MLNAYEVASPIDIKNQELSELLRNHFASVEEITERFKNEVLSKLGSEPLHADDDEKAIMLDLSNEIAAARNSDDLFQAVHDKLATFFDIDGLTIILTGNEKDSYLFYEFEKGQTLSTDSVLKAGKRHLTSSLLTSVLKELTVLDAPVNFDTALCADRHPEFALFRTWENKGWQKFAIVTLKVKGDAFGYLLIHMNSLAVDSVRSNLLRGICAQLSVGLSNINMIEEALRRKNEMELLLSINTGIASVRSTEELAKFIRDKFKQLLGCSHTMIAVCNADGLTFSAFLLDEDARAKTAPLNLNAQDNCNRINDEVLNQSWQTDTPLLFDLNELASKENLPLYIKINKELQQKALLITRLAKGEDVFGFWLIYFKNKEIITSSKLQFIQSLAHQLCISVANIIANQEIKTREDEKGRLLKFSNAIAPLRDKGLLSKVLKVQLNEIFGIEEYIIHVFNKETNTYIPFLYSFDTTAEDYPETVNTSEAMMVFPEGLINLIAGNEGPVPYTVNDDFVPFLIDDSFAENTDAAARLGMFIQLGSEGTAALSFIHPDFKQIKQQEMLLKSICSQISIAVSNIIANEKVNQQLLEIDRYKRQLEEETVYLKEEIEVNQNYAEIIGESQVIQKTFRMVTQVAPSDSTVLILGETGTGKELIARAIHNNSPRKNKLMVKVNCAALPANLIESELFGHEKGSFTGATERRLGKFELANNGTLFLDEIGEMPLELQVKLLRALQEKEIERVGGRGTIKVDVRIIAATNRDLEKEVDEGRFRSDLYYRLNIFPIELSALRDRKEDIPILATHFIHRYSKKTGRQITTLGSKALQDMLQYNWPGNIRELEHLIERSILLTTGPTLKQIYLPNNKPGNTVTTNIGTVVLKSIDENECEHILKILKYCQGRISGSGGAADILGVPPSTLNSKIKRLGIKKEHLI